MSDNLHRRKKLDERQNLPLLTKCYSMALSIICYHKLPLTFLYLFLPFIHVRISKILISSIQQKRHQLSKASVLIFRMPYHPSFEIPIPHILYNHPIRKSHIHILTSTIRNNLSFKSAFHNFFSPI